MYLQSAVRGCGQVASVIMVVAFASCADRPTSVSANRMEGRRAMLVEGGLSDGGMEGASASGTYTFWPPYGFSLVSPEYGDKGTPCYHDVAHPSPPDRPVTGACNAGTSVRAIGTVTPMTGVVPTPGQDAGVIIDPYKPNRPFSLIATQDVEDFVRYAVKKSALRKGFGNGLTSAVADRVVLSLDWRFATTEFNTGAGGNDAAWLEFKPDDGSPTVELLRISRNDLQPNGSGPLHPIALEGGVRRDCGAFLLGGSVANYVLCTDWSRLAIELTNPALTAPGTLYFRVEEADPPVTDVNGVVSPAIPDTPSAFLFDNLNLTRIVVSALQNTSVALTPGVLGMGSPPPDHDLVGYQWFIDERYCTLGTVATLENTTMTCTRPNRYIIALRRIMQSTTLTLPNDPLVFVRDTLYRYAAIEITGPALIPGSATLGTMPSVPTEGQAFTVALSNVLGSAPLTFVVTCGALSSNTSALVCPTQDNGSVAISGTIDGPGGGNVYSGIVQVANVAPTATFGFSSLPVPEGTSFTLELTGVSDPGPLDVAAGFTYAFDCGDGSGFGAQTATASRSCPTTLPGPRSVKGRVRDKDGQISR